MAEQKVKLTELPTATDTLDTAQLLVNQNSTDQKLAITDLDPPSPNSFCILS